MEPWSVSDCSRVTCRLLYCLQSWLKDASNTFSGIDGINSGGYAVVTASLLAAGIGYLVLPYPTLVGVFGSSAAQAGPEAIILWQLIGAGVSMIVGPIAYSLRVRGVLPCQNLTSGLIKRVHTTLQPVVY